MCLNPPLATGFFHVQDPPSSHPFAAENIAYLAYRRRFSSFLASWYST